MRASSWCLVRLGPGLDLQHSPCKLACGVLIMRVSGCCAPRHPEAFLVGRYFLIRVRWAAGHFRPAGSKSACSLTC